MACIQTLENVIYRQHARGIKQLIPGIQKRNRRAARGRREGGWVVTRERKGWDTGVRAYRGTALLGNPTSGSWPQLASSTLPASIRPACSPARAPRLVALRARTRVEARRRAHGARTIPALPPDLCKEGAQGIRRPGAAASAEVTRFNNHTQQ